MKIHCSLKNRILLAALLLTAAILCPNLEAKIHSEEKPNIIMIFVDDMGYGDVGCYGGKMIPTPNIDRLAREGILCTDGYVTAPLCAPSRCGLLTGAYNQRFGMDNNLDRGKAWYKIPSAHKVLPEALSAAGYITAHFGKWNIARDARSACTEVYDLMDFVGGYFPNAQGVFPGVDGAPMDKTARWGWGSGKEEYLTDRITRHAMEFIDKHSREPFFMYVAYNAPHTPLEADVKFKETLAQIKDEPLQIYYAMLASIDQAVGKILAHLEGKGVLQNTLIVFSSDNGPAHGSSKKADWPGTWPERILLGSSGPLNGQKGTMLEGGIRVPYILHWPARFKGGQVYKQPVSTMDLYPTFCEAAGAAIPKETVLDGVSLLPFLGGSKHGAPHDKLFWRMWNAELKEDVAAVREGDWKTVMGPHSKRQNAGQNGRIHLYNLKDDIGEKQDVAGSHPDVVKKLMDDWNAWNSTMPKPPIRAAKGAGVGKK